MVKETSIAPKERVNIVYRPHVGDVKEDVELSLKVLVLSDFTGEADNRPLENRTPLNIDKDNFNDVLKASNVKANIKVKNQLSSDKDAELSLNLAFKNIKDFSPDSIMEQVPELTQMKELREALKALKGPLGNIPEFRKKIQDIIKDDSARARLLKELNIES